MYQGYQRFEAGDCPRYAALEGAWTGAGRILHAAGRDGCAILSDRILCGLVDARVAREAEVVVAGVVDERSPADGGGVCSGAVVEGEEGVAEGFNAIEVLTEAAVGGGLGLALVADFRIASPAARSRSAPMVVCAASTIRLNSSAEPKLASNSVGSRIQYPWYAYCFNINITGPRCDIASAHASTIIRSVISWLSIPVTSTLSLYRPITWASLPMIPPLAPLSTRAPRLERCITVLVTR